LVETESAPGGGTTVHLFFPAARVQEIGWAEETFLTMNSNRVLVMDDEPVIREILHSMLGLLGYEVSLAADGAEALRMHAEAKERGRPFGAILMDLSVVEGMGGKEAIARLRAGDQDTPVVVSSGYSNDPVIENYRQYGFNGMVTKPYQFENLARALVELRPHQPGS